MQVVGPMHYLFRASIVKSYLPTLIKPCTAGYGISEAVQRRGLLEDTRLGLELAVTSAFDALRAAVRALLLLPPPQSAVAHEVRAAQAICLEGVGVGAGPRALGDWQMSRVVGVDAGPLWVTRGPRPCVPACVEEGTASGREQVVSHRAPLVLPQDGWAARLMLGTSARPSATSKFEDLHVWTASDVILQVGTRLLVWGKDWSRGEGWGWAGPVVLMPARVDCLGRHPAGAVGQG